QLGDKPADERRTSVACRAAGAISDRDEFRLKLLQLLHDRPQSGFRSSIAPWKELERYLDLVTRTHAVLSPVCFSVATSTRGSRATHSLTTSPLAEPSIRWVSSGTSPAARIHSSICVSGKP